MRTLLVLAAVVFVAPCFGNRVVRRVAPAGASFADSFDRGNQFPISSANWSNAVGGTSDTYLLNSKVTGAGGGTATSASILRVTTTAAAFANNHFASVTTPPDNSGGFGPAVRIQSGSAQCYFVYHDGSEWQIVKQTAASGSWSVSFVGSALPGSAPSTGDVVKLEATGTSTTTLTLRVNGTTIGARTDSTSPLTGGQPGIYTAQSNYADGFSAADL